MNTIPSTIVTLDKSAQAVTKVTDAKQAARLARGRAPIEMYNASGKELEAFMQAVRAELRKIYYTGAYEVKNANREHGQGFMIVKGAAR